MEMLILGERFHTLTARNGREAAVGRGLSLVTAFVPSKFSEAMQKHASGLLAVQILYTEINTVVNETGLGRSYISSHGRHETGRSVSTFSITSPQPLSIHST